jgi:hypothetical protein
MRDRRGTAECLSESIRRMEIQETAPRIVNYNQTTFIKINLAETQNKTPPIPTRTNESLNRANEHHALDLKGNPDVSNSHRRVPLKSRKIDWAHGSQNLPIPDPRINLYERSPRSMTNHGAPLNEIVEDNNEWGTDSFK